ncbi:MULTISPECIES: CDP-glycerol glycerophosphotransferase family protein [Nitrosomonas]|nr:MULTISPECIES: CDP-glycerol glycerophosphotransferase family protein [Nitrosomonas]SDW92851.1 CDP-glycerol glycerophosphotransferase, TagB/SpsB family [Nitrosomonas europaea]SET46257.1 CDP-glycerol glycerophosphotransferase, TagB/SpsB family [Nitrosomonas europaea]SKA02542.1 CDP-glycerol glycerophosphotransferase, TagB/SpsB family [Nitrosomonas europaea]
MSGSEPVYQEPPTAYWRAPSSYDARLREDFLASLKSSSTTLGAVPQPMQIDVLRRLHWYFTVDGRERAPTAIVGVEAAQAFHALIGEILQYVDPGLIGRFSDPAVSSEIRHVLYSWHGKPVCSAAILDCYDHAQQLVKLRYFVHGEPPVEAWLVDGKAVEPAFAKYRGCRYYHRSCMQQRIVWLPVAQGSKLQLRLNGQPHAIELDESGFFARSVSEDETFDLAGARAAFWPGRGGRRRSRPLLKSLKAGLLALYAALPWVRARYRRAWVFLDRHENADDNAEHLYRWVTAKQPQINAWFLLKPDSPDWARLEQEGFQLLAPNGLQRKLLVLNSENIISSHAEYGAGGFDPRVYAPYMRWRYTFLQHGTILNDLSHWLGPLQFDLFSTSSLVEYQSIAEDGGNYPYSKREVSFTGLPRHDCLLRKARERKPPSSKTLLVMPTWRGGTFEEQAKDLSADERQQLFAQTDYARAWKSLLHNPALHAALQQHGWQLSFMPHMNTLPFLDVFELSPEIRLVSVLDGHIQEALVSADAFLTDYTSVTFDIALLRRPSFYYQFDRTLFYGGGHNWRPGYFDYERDGFGPVAFSENELLQQLLAFLENGGEVPALYRERMERAMPLDDELACQRCFDRISSLNQPWQG